VESTKPRLYLKIKVTPNLYRSLALKEVEDPRICRQLAHEGGECVSTTHQPPFPHRGYHRYLFPLEVEQTTCDSVGIINRYKQVTRTAFNPFRSYVGPRPTLWFSCSRRFSWTLTPSNPIFLPPAYSPAPIYFGRERGWWITCNYPTVLKDKNRNRRNTTCAICRLKFLLLIH
jgi:hypothetical protein